MSVFRRKRLPDELVGPHESFVQVLAEIEPAKEALTEVMPTTRLPGRPLPDALAEFERRLDAAREVMPGWRRDETEAVWTACDAGIAEALARARRMRKTPRTSGGSRVSSGRSRSCSIRSSPSEERQSISIPFGCRAHDGARAGWHG